MTPYPAGYGAWLDALFRRAEDASRRTPIWARPIDMREEVPVLSGPVRPATPAASPALISAIATYLRGRTGPWEADAQAILNLAAAHGWVGPTGGDT